MPVIQGRMSRNAPTSKADAAAKFTEIAAGVADDYAEVREELRELKPLLRELIRILDDLTPKCEETKDSVRLKEVIDSIRPRIY
ncbi:hypothetical protein [Nocardia wallacei]|uniref:hypothetical protein n=1 Tax=Nocardia wallacei TaxID=480035 RepID=UPI002458EC4F|nr:hypothetical protein [Nocardia wallacei]